MKPERIVNVRATHTATCDGLSRFDLLAWVNKMLSSNFGKVDELCTGAAYCQLMHSLFPNKISLARVKFNTNLEHDFIDNFKLLQTTFLKLSVQKSIPIERLCKGRFQDNIEFLQWFKKFYEANDRKDKHYDPVAARNGQIMGYGLKITKPPKVVEKRFKPRSPTNGGENSFRSLNQVKETIPPELKLQRSLTKIQIKKKFDEVDIETMNDDNMGDASSINGTEILSQSSDEPIMDTMEDVSPTNGNEFFSQSSEESFENDDQNEIFQLRTKLAQMDVELRDTKEKLSSAQKTRDKFYKKLKDIGYCIKETEDAGIATIDTLTIANILLGDGFTSRKIQEATEANNNVKTFIDKDLQHEDLSDSNQLQ